MLIDFYVSSHQSFLHGVPGKELTQYLPMSQLLGLDTRLSLHLVRVRYLVQHLLLYAVLALHTCCVQKGVSSQNSTACLSMKGTMLTDQVLCGILIRYIAL